MPGALLQNIHVMWDWPQIMAVDMPFRILGWVARDRSAVETCTVHRSRMQDHHGSLSVLQASVCISCLDC